jgi:hypothetical protein
VAAPEKDVTTEKDAIPHYQPDPEDGPRFATQREPAEVDQADEPYFAMQPDAFEAGLHDQPAFAVQPGAVEPDAEDEPLFSIQPATAAAEGQPAAVAGNDHEPLFSFPAEAREAEEDEPFFALQAEAAASASSADDLASPVQGVPGAIPGSLVPEDVFSGSELAEPIAEGEQGEAVSVGLPQTEDSWPPQSELPPEPVGNDVAENIVQVAEPAPWDAGIAEDRAHLNAADREWGLAEEMPAPIGLAEPPPAEMAAADLTQLDSIEGAELAFEAAPAAEAPTELIQAIVAEAWERTEPAAEHLSEKAPAYDANPATEQNGEFPATPEISHAQNADWIVGEMQVSGEEKSLSLAQEMRKALLAAAAAAKAILGVTPAAEEHAEFETEPEPATFDHPEPIVLPELVEPVVVTVSDEPPSPPEVLDPCGEDHAELYASVDQGAPAEAAGDAAAAPAPARQAERLLDEDTINQVVQRVMERMQPTLIAEITRELSQKRRKYSKEEEH